MRRCPALSPSNFQVLSSNFRNALGRSPFCRRQNRNPANRLMLARSSAWYGHCGARPRVPPDARVDRACRPRAGAGGCAAAGRTRRSRPSGRDGRATRSVGAAAVAADGRRGRADHTRPPPIKEPGPMRVGRGPSGQRLDTVVQDSPSAPAIPLPSFTFEGVSNVNGVLPPDTNGDVGPNHYVQWVNLSFAIWSKGTADDAAGAAVRARPGQRAVAGLRRTVRVQERRRPDRHVRPSRRSLVDEPARAAEHLLWIPVRSLLPVHRGLGDAGSDGRVSPVSVRLQQAERLPEIRVVAGRLLHGDQPVSGVVAAIRRTGRRRLRSQQDAGRPAGVDGVLRSCLGGHQPRRHAAEPFDGPAPPSGSPELFRADGRRCVGLLAGSAADVAVPRRLGAAERHPRSRRPAALPTAPFDSDLCGLCRELHSAARHDGEGRRAWPIG